MGRRGRYFHLQTLKPNRWPCWTNQQGQRLHLIGQHFNQQVWKMNFRPERMKQQPQHFVLRTPFLSHLGIVKQKGCWFLKKQVLFCVTYRSLLVNLITHIENKFNPFCWNMKDISNYANQGLKIGLDKCRRHEILVGNTWI